VPIFVLTHEPPPVLRVDVMPVLLGADLRLFDEEDPVRAGLEKIAVREIGPRTSLRFRIQT
jgi:hypothetical protein